MIDMIWIYVGVPILLVLIVGLAAGQADPVPEPPRSSLDL